MNGKNQEKVSYAEIAYLLYFAVMLGARAVGLYEGMLIYNVSLALGMLLFAVKILMTEHTLLDYLWMGVLLILALWVYHKTGEKGLLVYFTMMLGVKGVSLRRTFKVGAIIWTFAFWGMFLMTLLGVIEDVCFMHEKHGIGFVVCRSMGYPHPNVFHIAYLVMSSFILYLVRPVRKRDFWFLMIGLLFGNLFVFLYSFSFTGCIAVTILLLLSVYFRFRTKISIFEKIILESIFPFCVLFSLLAPVLTQGRVFEVLNKITNTRLALSEYFLTEQPITLFGTRLIVSNPTYTMDCSYVYLFVQLGVVTFLLVCALYSGLIHHDIRTDKRNELALILTFCIAGVTEPFMFNLAYKNLIFLFLGKLLFDYADKVSVRSHLLGQKVQIIKAGSFMVTLETGWKQRIRTQISRIKAVIHMQFKNLIAALVISLGVSVYLCSMLIPRISVIYVSRTMNLGDDNPVYLTSENVQQIRSAGGMVLGYLDDKKPMFAYYGNTTLIEYWRKIFSMGLLCSLTVCIILVCVMSKNKGGKR